MNKSNKILVILNIGFALLLFLLPNAIAQAQATETLEPNSAITPTTLTEPVEQEVKTIEEKILTEAVEETLLKTDKQSSVEVVQDQNITADILGIKKQKILPTSRLYTFKNFWRGTRTAFTFNPIKKANLQLRYANEQLIEAKKMANKEDNHELVIKSITKYNEQIANASDVIKKASKQDIDKVLEFEDKIIKNSFQHQNLIEGIANKLKPVMTERIIKLKENGIKHLAKTIENSVEPEKIEGKINLMIKNQTASEFKNFKNLEILKAIEDKMPEERKIIIKNIQKKTLEKLGNDLEKMEQSQRERFNQYIKYTGGDKIQHLKIIDDINHLEVPENIRQEMAKAKEQAIEQIEEKIKKLETKEHKQEFFRHLEEGRMEDLRIVKELENNLSPEVIEKVIEIKNKTFNKFKEKMANAKTPEKQEKIFKEMSEIKDVKQFEVFKEIEKIIPEDKQEFFKKMKEKSINEMETRIKNVKNKEQREMILERISGDRPEQIELIKEFIPAGEAREYIMNKQAVKINRKIKEINNPNRLQIMEERITNQVDLKREIEKRTPAIFERIKEKNNEIINNQVQIETNKLIKQKILPAKEIKELEKIWKEKLKNKEQITTDELMPFLKNLDLSNEKIQQIKQQASKIEKNTLIKKLVPIKNLPKTINKLEEEYRNIKRMDFDDNRVEKEFNDNRVEKEFNKTKSSTGGIWDRIKNKLQ
ncbi:hypothetical protein ISS06_01060 [Patescibacteria group bacterium]|nr:hypothetical protein [Patescibacteria group bacterium]